METGGSEHKREEPRDHISVLPDEIAQHILSFLPVNLMAQTGILSERWSYLWRSFPRLDFTNIYKNGLNQENQGIPLDSAIISVLLNRQQGSNIKLFRLKGSVSSPSLLICLGLLVSDHEFEELDLDVPLINHFKLPHYLFSYQPLRALTLKSSNPSACFIFSTTLFMVSSRFKSLHTLSLTWVYFTLTPSIHNLFSDSTFPILKRLYLCHCKRVDRLNISSKTLEKLEISDLSIEGLTICCKKLEVLKVTRCFETSSIVLKEAHISAPQLNTFSWEDNANIEKCWIESLPCLNSWRLSVHPEVPNKTVLISVATLISAASFVRSLYVEIPVISLLAKIDFAGIRLNTLENVTTLTLHSALNKHEIPGVACILRCCPKLGKLTAVIHNVMKNSQEIWTREDLDKVKMTEDEYWQSQSQRQKSMLEQLQFVTIDVQGHVIFESTISLIKFVLGHGRVLKSMELTTSLGHPHGPSLRQYLQQTTQRIMEFKRASPDVQLIL